MTGNESPKKSPWLFFILVYAFSIPFWVVNVLFPMNLPIDNLPVTDIGATCMPLVAAAIIVYREDEPGGVRRFLARAFDYRRITDKRWYIPIIFLMPALYVLTYWTMRFLGIPVPSEYHIPVTVPLIFLVFFLAAALEEMGYTGYATDPLQARYGALNAALIMGPIHMAWHWPSMIALGQPAGLFVMGSILTIAFRVLTVWIYNNAGHSVFATILFHTITNTGRSTFPGSRAAYELADGMVGYTFIMIAAVIVALLWDKATLTRFRFTRKM
ncbi:MAG: CPBP family intramembrane glutamic endopeptidase [Methanoregula sp.]